MENKNMTININTLRPVLTQPEHDFGLLLGKVLSPSRPLQSEEYLRGRAEQLNGIRRALFQAGRHVLIYGNRGVGKSSLAQTTAFLLSEGGDPILISCDCKSTLSTVVCDIFNEVKNSDPSFDKKITEVGGGGARFGLNFFAKRSIQEGVPDAPETINEAVRFLRFLAEFYARKLVVVIDEFDQIKDKYIQSEFANLAKQISDKHVNASLIFCGIASSPEQLMEAHGSADRFFHTVELQPLSWEARFEILESSSESLGIIIDKTSMQRISRISDGFPHYIHFVAEKLFWRVFEAKNNGYVTPDIFNISISDASREMDMKLKGPYEKATQKYGNDYEFILWAVADGHELMRRSSDIFDSYIKLMQNMSGRDVLDRPKFNQRMNSLKRESHASILTGTRQGWYEFTEKVIRGYVRLRAEERGISLGSDHPAIARIVHSDY